MQVIQFSMKRYCDSVFFGLGDPWKKRNVLRGNKHDRTITSNKQSIRVKENGGGVLVVR